MIQNPSITTRELAEKIGISPKSIEKQISYLKKSNRVKRVGGRSNGQWIILPHLMKPNEFRYTAWTKV